MTLKTDAERQDARDAYAAYKTEADRRIAAGDIEGFVIWKRDNPSPPLKAAPFSDEPPTERQALDSALLAMAHAFKGQKVELDATDEPGAFTRLVWHVTGTILGSGFLQGEGNGARDLDIIIVQTEAYRIDAVRVSHIVGCRNAD